MLPFLLDRGFRTQWRVPEISLTSPSEFTPKFHTPSGALVFQGLLTVLLVLTGTYEEVYSYAIFAIWIFLGLSSLAVIRLRSTEPDLPRPFRVWGYPWTPLLFGFAALAISINLWLVRPVRSSIGLMIMLTGIPFFYYWRRRGVISSDREVAPSGN